MARTSAAPRPATSTTYPIGGRLRAARRRVGWTQQQLAGERYTKAYVSALENGLVKPSVAALTYLAERLGMPPAAFLAGDEQAWSRLTADIHLASGDWGAAADSYGGLLAEVTDPVAGADLRRGLAEALCRLDRGREAIEPAAAAVAAYARLERRADAALATYWLAFAHYLSDSLAEARSLLRGLIDALRAGLSVEPDLEIRVVVAMAAVEYRDGERERALALLAQARDQAATLDDLRRATYAYALAASYRELGDLEAALRHGHQSLALYRAAAAERDAASIANDLALTYLALGNLGTAEELALEAMVVFDGLGDERKLAHVLDTRAQIALGRGRLVDAIALATDAIARAEATGNTKALVDGLTTRARAHAATRAEDAASQDFGRAAELARANGSRARRNEVLRAWGEMLASAGRHKAAYDLLQEALAAG
jgi:transcriptional regulator with XRE-family HTH domain